MSASSKWSLALTVAAGPIAAVLGAQGEPQLTTSQSWSVIALLYAVLAGVGAFLAKIGYDMVKSVQSNTMAVQRLAASLESLALAQKESSADMMKHMESHTDAVLAAVKEIVASSFREEELRRLRERGNGNGDEKQ